MKVKIKTWEHLEAEFGILDGGIECQGCFTPEMEKELPPDRIIEVTKCKWSNYFISEDMIEEYLKDGVEVCSICGETKDICPTEESYFGKFNNKYLLDYNGTRCRVADSIEIIPTLTKKEAKQKVSELFANPKSVTSQQIRDIIDLIKEK